MLTRQELTGIHGASLGILERAGMVFRDAVILARLADHGVRVQGQRAYFPPDVLMGWVAQAPSRFTLHAPDPARDLAFGGGSHHYAPAYGAALVAGDRGAWREATLADYLTLARLVESAPELAMNGGILVEPQDLPTAWRRPLMFFAALRLSEKALLGIPGGGEETGRILDLAELAAGGREALAARPRVLTLINTLSPLQLDASAAGSLVALCARRQPVIVTPGPMAGATGPVTLAGNLALANAECLAVIAVGQMLAPGLPMLYGVNPTTLEMRGGGVSIGAPGFAIMAQACAELARFHGLPSRGGGASTDARYPSLQSGYEGMLSLLAGRQAGLDLMLHSAGILGGYAAVSSQQLVADLEMIRAVERFLAGLRVDQESLARAVIEEVGPEGQFLTHPHTLRHCREEAWVPRLFAKGGDRAEWTEGFERSLAAERSRLLASYRLPPREAKLLTELTSYLTSLGAPAELVADIADPQGA